MNWSFLLIVLLVLKTSLRNSLRSCVALRDRSPGTERRWRNKRNKWLEFAHARTHMQDNIRNRSFSVLGLFFCVLNFYPLHQSFIMTPQLLQHIDTLLNTCLNPLSTINEWAWLVNGSKWIDKSVLVRWLCSRQVKLLHTDTHSCGGTTSRLFSQMSVTFSISARWKKLTLVFPTQLY